MTLALATRGYLCFGKAISIPYGPGPKITGSIEISPGIDGAAVMSGEAPSIMGAGVQGPTIVKSANPTPQPAGDGPVIVGAGVVKPDIEE
jgi:hypothetical protein